MELYENQAAFFAQKAIDLNQQLSRLRLVRLFFGVLFLASAVLFAVHGTWIYILSFILGVGAFMVAVKFYGKKEKAVAEAKAHEATYRDEIAATREEFRSPEQGQRFEEENHLYTYDLDVFGPHSLFEYLNRSHTELGKKTLALWLSHRLSTDQINDHQSIIAEWKKHTEWRMSFSAFARMTKDTPEQHQKLMAWIKGQPTEVPKTALFLSYLFPAIMAALIIGGFISGQVLCYKFAGLLFTLQLGLLATVFKSLMAEADSFDQIKEHFTSYTRLFKWVETNPFEHERTKEQTSVFFEGKKPSSHLLAQLELHVSSLSNVQNLVGVILFNGLASHHIRVYHQLVMWKKNHRHQMTQWFEVIGQWEALHSLTQFAVNNLTYSFPEISEKPCYSFTQLGHPLIKPQSRVNNDFSFTEPRFMILTGSNMSGKSTFLRTVGINLALANCGSVVCAEKAVIRPCDVMVSMRLNDSLADSTSYFFAEITRIKTILDQLNEETFVLFDELLRGTNSDDKREGTLALLRNLQQRRATGIIATHDLEVCDITSSDPSYFCNYNFEVHIQNNDLHFDYLLQPGVCKNKSATFLMKKQGII